LFGASVSNYMDYGMEIFKRPSGAAYGCLVAGQSLWARTWTPAYTLYARSVCDTKEPPQL